MKKLYQKLFVLAALLFSFTVTQTHAQLTGGGNSNPQPAEEEEVKVSTDESLFSKGTILKVGWSNPVGNFGMIPQTSDTYRDIFSSKGGLGAQKGFTAGIDFLFPINVRQNFNGVKTELGLKLGFNYAQNKIDWSELGGQWETDASYEGFHFIDTKAGIIVAVNPVDDLIFDLFYNPMFSIVSAGEIYVNYEDFNNGYVLNEDIYPGGSENSEIPLGIRHGIGFNIRYRALLFSVENIWGPLDYNYYHEVTYTYTDNFTTDSEQYNYSSAMTNNITLITIGIAL